MRAHEVNDGAVWEKCRLTEGWPCIEEGTMSKKGGKQNTGVTELSEPTEKKHVYQQKMEAELKEWQAVL